ncbi:protein DETOXIFICATION 12 isoform X1 [Eucalyptus grandis]|uniref:protein DETOXIFICATION 12 isoform X1 n=1 Tax=Eucalyptus grandis TaxID=71139 RepID=UPI00192EAF16|nr:protein DETOXIFICATION 12 isoform X1 [Eucalyptus grandis]
MEEALLQEKERPEERDGRYDDPEEEEEEKKNGEGGGGRSWSASCCAWPRRRAFCEEVKRVGQVAGPLVVVSLLQFLLQVISVMMVGHLGELSLSSTSIAVSLAGVSGFSLLLGMASALETLCGQAYGAQQYHKLGTQTYTAIFSLILVCFPISVLWIYMGKVLAFIGQDRLISLEAGKFTAWLVPALFAYATLQPLIRYFQTQSLIMPMLVSSCATLCIHVPLCWVLVFRSGLDNLGAALAISVSYWLNVVFLGVYMKYSPSCTKTRVPVSMELFRGIGEFFRYAVPSAVMVCLEWWSFELLVLLSGILPNPQLETSVLSVWYILYFVDYHLQNVNLSILNCTKFSIQEWKDFPIYLLCNVENLNVLISSFWFLISLNTIATLYMIPYGLGAAGSTRVSNELGAGNPEAARLSVYATLFLTITETIIVSTILFISRRVFGYTFSNEEEVVDYVTKMAPLVCLSVILDSLLGVLTGIARGCGWQHIGAFVNLGSFYLCGIPVAVFLGFWVKLGGMGLWMGIQTGSLVQAVLLFIVTSCTDWEVQASKARERVFEGRHSEDHVLM